MMMMLFLVLAILFIIIIRKTGEQFVSSDVGNVGNKLTEYVQEMGRAWSTGVDFVYESGNGKYFYENLPKRVEKPKDLTITLPKNYKEWIIDTEEKRKFYEDLKPYVHKILDEALKKTGVEVNQILPVIHFRCSDAPFSCITGQPTDMCTDYHFQKYDFYKKALGDYKEVEILTCNRHNSNERMQKACEEYSRHLKEELGVTVYLKMCEGDALEDFAKMFYAPLVISMGSSMSFMAGYFGKGEFVTGGHVFEKEDGTIESTCKICKYGPETNLLHKDSGGDYYDVETVHEKLKLFSEYEL